MGGEGEELPKLLQQITQHLTLCLALGEEGSPSSQTLQFPSAFAIPTSNATKSSLVSPNVPAGAQDGGDRPINPLSLGWMGIHGIHTQIQLSLELGDTDQGRTWPPKCWVKGWPR